MLCVIRTSTAPHRILWVWGFGYTKKERLIMTFSAFGWEFIMQQKSISFAKQMGWCVYALFSYTDYFLCVKFSYCFGCTFISPCRLFKCPTALPSVTLSGWSSHTSVRSVSVLHRTLCNWKEVPKTEMFSSPEAIWNRSGVETFLCFSCAWQPFTVFN